MQGKQAWWQKGTEKRKLWEQVEAGQHTPRTKTEVRPIHLEVAASSGVGLAQQLRVLRLALLTIASGCKSTTSTAAAGCSGGII